MNLSKFFKTLGLTTALAISSAVLVQSKSIAASAPTVCKTVLTGTVTAGATTNDATPATVNMGSFTGTAVDTVLTGTVLQPGECVLSTSANASTPSGAFLIFQTDGNLVLYTAVGQKILYSSGTSGKTPYQAVMQSDGNFVAYSTTSVLWASGTSGKSGSFVKVQDDGNMVIYQMATTPQFSTGTFVSK